jgi:hypothetical protein
MSDQHMNASDQGSQPDSGSAPNDQVTLDAQGSNRNKGGTGAQPLETPNPAAENAHKPDVTEAAHRHGQNKK